MENKYEIFCLVNGDQHKTYVYLYEEKENYQIKFELDDIIIWSKGKNYFDALIKLTPLYNFQTKMPYETLWCIISLQTKTHERSDLIRQPYYTTTNT